jgi:hypothetical protein
MKSHHQGASENAGTPGPRDKKEHTKLHQTLRRLCFSKLFSLEGNTNGPEMPARSDGGERAEL